MQGDCIYGSDDSTDYNHSHYHHYSGESDDDNDDDDDIYIMMQCLSVCNEKWALA